MALLPIMGVVGAAVNYSRANSDKAAMQAAIDATALWLSKNAATLTAAQLNQNATNHFNAVFTRTDVTNIAVTPTYTTSGGTQLVVTGTGSVPTKFMGLMGFSSLAINVSSTVKWGNTRLRVALVLDNTGSMADSGKIILLTSSSAIVTTFNQIGTALSNLRVAK